MLFHNNSQEFKHAVPLDKSNILIDTTAFFMFYSTNNRWYRSIHYNISDSIWICLAHHCVNKTMLKMLRNKDNVENEKYKSHIH